MTTYQPQVSLELRIKGYTLTQEARIIRKWENRLKQARLYEPKCQEKMFELRRHRLKEVRPEARCTYLAFGFLRGRDYTMMENLRYSDPNWSNIERMVKRYGDPGINDERVVAQRFEEWKQAAGKPAKRQPRKPKTESVSDSV